ncbi:MAG TPA: CRISPR-associated protein Cas4 [Dehalococcoidia bacterium]|nr:CRISPR-associated protein Cas4 [Dehalococcoidia bacterium]
MLPVTDVKQYPYCPRVVYYSHLLPQRARPATFKMQAGRDEHERQAALEDRRTLRAYGLAEGRRHFDVQLTSSRLGLSGRLDLVIETETELVPVDFKSSEGKAGLNHKYQLTAYALLLEDAWPAGGPGAVGGRRRPVRRGFIYLTPRKQAEEVRITSNMRGWVHKALREVRAMLAAESKPEPTRVRGRCRDCEYRNYCPEVW